ncbi:hypothetical protein [Brumimicrobium mesophilum]|uniref:hypothetical protein n=1 Tax=Brumimicrobium mesophilum TaxID=392717 RepID=UPI000D13F282|nr:hypothetical protein [Brumimicrobium mesophilum]
MKLSTLLLIPFFILSNFILAQEKPNGNMRAWYEIGNEEKIDASKIKPRPNELYFQFNVNEKAKNLESLGFGWTDDNPENHFIAHLINTTDSTFNAKLQDGSLLMIQEAMNEKGRWSPIEYWVTSGCGNSYFRSLNLEPGHQVMIPIKKYHGSLKTKMRLKLQTGKEIIYSEIFEGSVEPRQFRRSTSTVHGILYHGPANYLEDW